MKALEHLLIQELAQIRTAESKLQDSYASLRDASAEQVENFLAGLADLEHRAVRAERLLEGMATSEQLAA